jgi:hypothetical protein
VDHDLRHDQEAADERTHYNLRTVHMPDLRSGECRTLDAQARDLRTAGDKIAELTQQVSTLGETVRLNDATLLAVALRLDELAAKVDELRAGPLAMAEDAWGCGG